MHAIAPFPVVVPLAVAAGLLLLNTVLSARVVQAVTFVAALAEVGLSLALLHVSASGTIVYWFGGWTPRHGLPFGVSFVIDPLGAGAAAFAGLIVAAAVAATRPTIGDAGGLVHALLLTVLAAMTGFCLSGDLFTLFVFLELMAVSAFGLAAYHIENRAGLRGALNLGITNSIGAFLFLIGIALLYARARTLNLAALGRQLVASGQVDRLVVLAFTAILVAFLIKAAVVPFHLWLID
jgi:multicomponent Na+:H+ antiporter subunit D